MGAIGRYKPGRFRGTGWCFVVHTRLIGWNTTRDTRTTDRSQIQNKLQPDHLRGRVKSQLCRGVILDLVHEYISYQANMWQHQPGWICGS